MSRILAREVFPLGEIQREVRERAEAGDFPRTLKYGLEIRAMPQVPEDFTFSGTARYAVSASRGEAKAFPFGMSAAAEIDQECENILSSRLAPHPSSPFLQIPFPLRNYFQARAFASFTSGVTVVAEEGSEASLTIESDFLGGNPADFVFVWAKRGAKLRVLEKNIGEARVCARTMFLFAEEGSRISLSSFQKFSPGTAGFLNRFSHILKNASVESVELSLGGKFVQSHGEDFLLDEGAEVLRRNISLAAHQEFDFWNAARHFAPATRSHLSARGILGAGGKVLYRGMIGVEKGMPSSRGAQEAKFLLAAPDAELDAIPSLDIANPDASSSHALSISHLHEGDFFYPGLRGLAPYEAQAMLFEGFLAEGISERGGVERGIERKDEDENFPVRDMIREKLGSAIYHI